MSNEAVFVLNCPDERAQDALVVEVSLDGIKLQVELDTGSAESLMSIEAFYVLFPGRDISSSTCALNSASGNIQVRGEVFVLVKFRDKLLSLKLILCSGVLFKFPLFGRSWLDPFVPGWRDQFCVNAVSPAIPKVGQSKVLYPNAFSKDPESCILGFKPY